MYYRLSYSENNIIGLIILLVIFFNMKSNNKKMKYDGKLYFTLIVSTSLIIVLDIIMDVVNGEPGYLLRQVHIIVTTIYFLLNVIPYMAWSLYVDFYIHKSIRRTKKLAPIFAIPAVISIILCVLSIYNKGVFFITKNNEYRRGDLFLLNAALYYSYCVGTYILIIIKRKNIRKSDYYPLLTFGIVPAIAGVLQTVYTNKAFLWLGISISCLIIYLNIQNVEINEDYLTGLYNRRQLDVHLKHCIRELGEDELIFMIMIDINFFKKINDTYGHIEGDKALKYAADILIDSFRSEDFIVRYAGDEFVIITKLKDENCKGEIINRLRRKFAEFSESDITPYEISVSFGYDIYDPELKMDADNFIIHVDKLMYKDKERIKESMRRNEAEYSYNE